MPSMTINFEGDGAWPDLNSKEVIPIEENIEVLVLDRGMTSGKPSVAFRFNLSDGRVVVAQTSAQLFCTAARAITARYPELFDENIVVRQ